jgi:lysozyme
MAGAARDVRLRVKVPLAMCEAAALISWTYNLGFGSLAKSPMLTRINANRKEDVPAEMRSGSARKASPLSASCGDAGPRRRSLPGIEPASACVRAWRDIDSLDD